jgi:hypothetical protein
MDFRKIPSQTYLYVDSRQPSEIGLKIWRTCTQSKVFSGREGQTRKIANAKPVVISAASHIVTVEAPDSFNDAVLAFLAGPPVSEEGDSQ